MVISPLGFEGNLELLDISKANGRILHSKSLGCSVCFVGTRFRSVRLKINGTFCRFSSLDSAINFTEFASWPQGFVFLARPTHASQGAMQTVIPRCGSIFLSWYPFLGGCSRESKRSASSSVGPQKKTKKRHTHRSVSESTHLVDTNWRPSGLQL